MGNHLIDDVVWITDQRVAYANQLDRAFSELSEFIKIPRRDSFERHVYHMYMVLVKERDRLHSYLNENGIEAKIHYPTPLHLQPASEKLGYRLGDFPVAEAQAKSIISFPVHQHLTPEEMDYQIQVVNRFYKEVL